MATDYKEIARRIKTDKPDVYGNLSDYDAAKLFTERNPSLASDVSFSSYKSQPKVQPKAEQYMSPASSSPNIGRNINLDASSIINNPNSNMFQNSNPLRVVPAQEIKRQAVADAIRNDGGNVYNNLNSLKADSMVNRNVNNASNEQLGLPAPAKTFGGQVKQMPSVGWRNIAGADVGIVKGGNDLHTSAADFFGDITNNVGNYFGQFDNPLAQSASKIIGKGMTGYFDAASERGRNADTYLADMQRRTLGFENPEFNGISSLNSPAVWAALVGGQIPNIGLARINPLLMGLPTSNYLGNVTDAEKLSGKPQTRLDKNKRIQEIENLYNQKKNSPSISDQESLPFIKNQLDSIKSAKDNTYKHFLGNAASVAAQAALEKYGFENMVGGNGIAKRVLPEIITEGAQNAIDQVVRNAVGSQKGINGNEVINDMAAALPVSLLFGAGGIKHDINNISNKLTGKQTGEDINTVKNNLYEQLQQIKQNQQQQQNNQPDGDIDFNIKQYEKNKNVNKATFDVDKYAKDKGVKEIMKRYGISKKYAEKVYDDYANSDYFEGYTHRISDEEAKEAEENQKIIREEDSNEPYDVRKAARFPDEKLNPHNRVHGFDDSIEKFVSNNYSNLKNNKQLNKGKTYKTFVKRVTNKDGSVEDIYDIGKDEFREENDATLEKITDEPKEQVTKEQFVDNAQKMADHIAGKNKKQTEINNDEISREVEEEFEENSSDTKYAENEIVYDERDEEGTPSGRRGSIIQVKDENTNNKDKNVQYVEEESSNEKYDTDTFINSDEIQQSLSDKKTASKKLKELYEKSYDKEDNSKEFSEYAAYQKEYNKRYSSKDFNEKIATDTGSKSYQKKQNEVTVEETEEQNEEPPVINDRLSRREINNTETQKIDLDKKISDETPTEGATIQDIVKEATEFFRTNKNQKGNVSKSFNKAMRKASDIIRESKRIPVNYKNNKEYEKVMLRIRKLYGDMKALASDNENSNSAEMREVVKADENQNRINNTSEEKTLQNTPVPSTENENTITIPKDELYSTEPGDNYGKLATMTVGDYVIVDARVLISKDIVQNGSFPDKTNKQKNKEIVDNLINAAKQKEEQGLYDEATQANHVKNSRYRHFYVLSNKDGGIKQLIPKKQYDYLIRNKNFVVKITNSSDINSPILVKDSTDNNIRALVLPMKNEETIETGGATTFVKNNNTNETNGTKKSIVSDIENTGKNVFDNIFNKLSTKLQQRAFPFKYKMDWSKISEDDETGLWKESSLKENIDRLINLKNKNDGKLSNRESEELSNYIDAYNNLYSRFKPLDRRTTVKEFLNGFGDNYIFDDNSITGVFYNSLKDIISQEPALENVRVALDRDDGLVELNDNTLGEESIDDDGDILIQISTHNMQKLIEDAAVADKVACFNRMLKKTIYHEFQHAVQDIVAKKSDKMKKLLEDSQKETEYFNDYRKDNEDYISKYIEMTTKRGIIGNKINKIKINHLKKYEILKATYKGYIEAYNDYKNTYIEAQAFQAGKTKKLISVKELSELINKEDFSDGQENIRTEQRRPKTSKYNGKNELRQNGNDVGNGDGHRNTSAGTVHNGRINRIPEKYSDLQKDNTKIQVGGLNNDSILQSNSVNQRLRALNNQNGNTQNTANTNTQNQSTQNAQQKTVNIKAPKGNNTNNSTTVSSRFNKTKSPQEHAKIRDKITKLAQERRSFIDKSNLEASQSINKVISKSKEIGKKYKTDEVTVRELMTFLRENSDMSEIENAKKILPKDGYRDLYRLHNKLSKQDLYDLKKTIDSASDELEGQWKDYAEYRDKYFDDDNASNVYARRNYILHSWEGNQNLAIPAIGKKIAQTTHSERERQFQTYKEGIDANSPKKALKGIIYIPTTLDAVELLKMHSKDVVTKVANGKFQKELGDNILVPNKNDKERIISYSYNPEFQKPLEAILGKEIENQKAPNKITKTYDTVNNQYKRFAITIGSLFHHSTLSESRNSFGNGIESLLPTNALKTQFNAVKNFLKDGDSEVFKNVPEAQQALKYGVKLGVTNDLDVEKANKELEKVLGKKLGRAASKFSQKMDKTLWDSLSNVYKMNTFNELVQKYESKPEYKDGVPDNIKRELAQFVNDSFGGQNYDNLQISDSAVKVANRILLSTDWTLSTMIRQSASILSSERMQRWLNKIGESSKAGYELKELCRKVGIGSITNDIEAAGIRGKEARIMFTKALIQAQVRAKFMTGLGLIMSSALSKGDDDRELEPKDFFNYNNQFDREFINLLFPDYYIGKDDQPIYENGEPTGETIHNAGKEMYVKQGKQFKEIPELVQGGLQYFGWNLMDRMASKSTPLFSSLLTKGVGKLADKYGDEYIKNKYGWKGNLKKHIPFTKKEYDAAIPLGMPFALSNIDKNSNKLNKLASSTYSSINRSKSTSFAAGHEIGKKLLKGDTNIKTEEFSKRLRANGLKDTDTAYDRLIGLEAQDYFKNKNSSINKNRDKRMRFINSLKKLGYDDADIQMMKDGTYIETQE